LSDFGLDRLRFDELSGEEERVARAHVSSCLRCARQLKSLQAADVEPVASAPIEKRKGLELVRVVAEHVDEVSAEVSVDSTPVRVGAESLRVIAEPLRVTAAPLRVIAESLRVTAEPLRVIAEPLRVTAEPLRVIAEPLRVIPEPPPVGPSSLTSAAPRRVRRWVAPLSLAAGVALAVALWPAPPTERLKGRVPFAVYTRSSAGAVQAVAPDSTLSPGAVIRFEVSPSAPAFVWVVGFDTAKVVSLYATSPGLLEGGKTHLLTEAIQLDETLGPERLVALFCPEPLTRAQVHDAGEQALARAAGAPRAVKGLALGCEEHSLVIEKQSP
jgi:hypothetical protein